MTYNDNFDGEQQVQLEEDIAAMIHDFDYGHGPNVTPPSVHDCMNLGRAILLHIVSELNPELVEKE